MSRQEEENELTNLSSESVLRAIDAVKGRAWDVNPFTVADELKVSRSLIYRHAEAMKLIIAARGGGFGMDVQTSLDLAGQLRKLEQQNNELKEKLASNPAQSYGEKIASIEESEANSGKNVDEVIFNFAANEPYGGDYSQQLANMSWKDLETIYYFKVASLKEHAGNIFSDGGKSDGTNGAEVANEVPESMAKASTSYNSISTADLNKQDRQSSISPFASLKSSKTKITQLQEPKLQGHMLPAEESKQLGKENILPEEYSLEEPHPEERPPEEHHLEEHHLEEHHLEEHHLEEHHLEEHPSLVEKIEDNSEIPSRISLSQSESAVLVPNQLASQIRAKLNFETETKIELESGVVQSEPPQETIQSVELVATEIESIIKAEPEWIPLEEISPQIKSPSDTGELVPIDVPIQSVNEEEKKTNTAISGDELRNLIQSHIKNAADQMADIHSIGTGKEFEVWFNNPAKSKFVGSTKTPESANYTEENAGTNTAAPANPASFKPRTVPPEVRKSCLILGIRMDNITYDIVQDAWKKAIAAPGVHPDQGGDTELAVYLNTAKDVLMRWLDAQAPKLGKKFGPYKSEKDVQMKKDDQMKKDHNKKD